MTEKQKLMNFFARKDISGGFSDDKDDKGGATMMDVTLATYTTYCQKKGLPKPTVNDLKKISLDVWEDIFECLFWQPCSADKIKNQVNACILVSWAWGSGVVTAIKQFQKSQGLIDNGIMGEKTISALEKANPAELCKYREKIFYAICQRNLSQNKFLNGWLRRLNEFKKIFNIQ